MRRIPWPARCYVLLVAAIAALGGLLGDGRFYLAAVVLTLPAGMAALIAVYATRGLLTVVAGQFADLQRPDGSDATWLTAAGATVNTLLFAAAAAAVVVLVHRLRQRATTG